MGEQLLARCYETQSKNVQAWAARGQQSNEVKPLEGLRISPGWESKGQVAPLERGVLVRLKVGCCVELRGHWWG